VPHLRESAPHFVALERDAREQHLLARVPIG
jgi:hypothetical protein